MMTKAGGTTPNAALYLGYGTAVSGQIPSARRSSAPRSPSTGKRTARAKCRGWSSCTTPREPR
jgi:hypothetical protein